ncbi:MAG: hypothetical protein V4773_05930 [Verrucomicrobiota bacterium]
MKTFMLVAVAALLGSGCASSKATRENVPLKSEREYAEASAARAADLYRTGQATSPAEARLRAAGEANQAWAAAAKTAESKAQQAQFDKELAGLKNGRE